MTGFRRVPIKNQSGVMVRKTKVMAVASGGGHWVQLRRMRPAWSDCVVSYVTTNAGYADEVLNDPLIQTDTQPGFFEVVDANRWQKARLLRQLFQLCILLLRIRPDVIVTTGAAPGFFALRFGKLLGARTVWVDSIANAEELSLSGAKANSCADLYLTQWPQLEGSIDKTRHRPKYCGSVI